MRNPKTTILGYADAVIFTLTILSAAAYELGPVAEVVSPEWKSRVLVFGIVTGALVKIIKGHVSADKNPHAETEEEAPKPSILSKVVLFLLVPAFLTGCASDGSFDAVGFGKAVGSAAEAYNSTQRPVIVGQDSMGNPIYR